MSGGQLKIVRALGNPRKAAKSAKPRRRKGVRQKKVRALSGKWVVRRVDRNSIATWWTGRTWGAKWSAKKYGSASAAAAIAHKAKNHFGKNWVVIDVMPA